MPQTPDEILTTLGEVFKAKNQAYGSAYDVYGNVMAVLLPEGFQLKLVDDHGNPDADMLSLLGTLSMMVTKMIRIFNLTLNPNHVNNQFEGIDDSAKDLAVYASMFASQYQKIVSKSQA